jgi:hypothetical protein
VSACEEPNQRFLVLVFFDDLWERVSHCHPLVLMNNFNVPFGCAFRRGKLKFSDLGHGEVLMDPTLSRAFQKIIISLLLTQKNKKNSERQKKSTRNVARKKANDSGIGHKNDASSAFPVHWSFPARCLG